MKLKSRYQHDGFEAEIHIEQRPHPHYADQTRLALIDQHGDEPVAPGSRVRLSDYRIVGARSDEIAALRVAGLGGLLEG